MSDGLEPWAVRALELRRSQHMGYQQIAREVEQPERAVRRMLQAEGAWDDDATRAVREREDRALALAEEHWTMQRIADELGWATKGAASRAVRRARERTGAAGTPS